MSVLSRGGVYVITNKINGLIYVGSTVRFRQRFKRHRYDIARGKGSPHFANAWKKYGSNAFDFSPVIVCERHELLFYEQMLIDGLEACNPTKGYNLSPTASSVLGIKRSNETKERLAACKRGKKRPADFCKMLSELKMGVPNLKARGVPKTAEHRANLSKAKTGLPSPKLGIPLTPEQNEKNRISHMGHIHSAEHKAKIAAGLKRAYAEGKRPKLQPGTKRGN